MIPTCGTADITQHGRRLKPEGNDYVAITFSETLISLAQAAKKIPSTRTNGCKLHPATLTRWINFGVRTKSGNRIKLEAVKVGAGFVTSEQAVDRFLEAISEDQSSQQESEDTSEKAPRKPSTPTSRKRRAASAEQELIDLGA
jgi:hypothetical protein